MAAYLVNHRYRAGLHAFDEGATVELDEAVAAHVNRDSPGTLSPLAGEPEPEPDPEPDPDVEPTPEPEPTQRRGGGRRGS